MALNEIEIQVLWNRLLSVVEEQAQVLVRTPLPCGGIAACGVCAVHLTGSSRDYRLACKDGPVFQLY